MSSIDAQKFRKMLSFPIVVSIQRVQSHLPPTVLNELLQSFAQSLLNEEIEKNEPKKHLKKHQSASQEMFYCKLTACWF